MSSYNWSNLQNAYNHRRILRLYKNDPVEYIQRILWLFTKDYNMDLKDASASRILKNCKISTSTATQEFLFHKTRKQTILRHSRFLGGLNLHCDKTRVFRFLPCYRTPTGQWEASIAFWNGWSTVKYKRHLNWKSRPQLFSGTTLNQRFEKHYWPQAHSVSEPKTQLCSRDFFL